MADLIDIANDRVQDTVTQEELRIRAEASKFVKGAPGDCELCGRWSGRLVEGACAPCRDKWGLK